MNIDLTKLKNRKTGISDREAYSEFSVLVPIVRINGNQYLLLEKRSEKLNKQPNEICFPGGKIEKMESAEQAALRETAEELMIEQKNIKIIGELDTIITPFNTIIYPFAGEIGEYDGTFNPDEVKEIFTVPLVYLMNTEPLRSDIDIRVKPREDFPYHMIREGRDYPWSKGRYSVYFYTYHDKIIWGITAKIIKNFVQILKK